MIDSAVLERIKRRCGYENGICVSSNGNSGGMGFWWHEVNVNVISYSVHHFAADICDSLGEPKWRAIDFYGWPETENKYETWDLMRNLKSECNLPCVTFGDLNEIVSMTKKSGGAVRHEYLMDAFREAIDDCGLRDLGFSGSIFTWQRGQTEDTVIRERLDRFLGDVPRCELWPNVKVQHIARMDSDHAPILLSTINYYERGRRKKLYRFEAMWISKPDCNEAVRKKKIRSLEIELQEGQGGHMDAASLQKCEKISGAINKLRCQEEIYWYARARANELKDGDINTTYFHRKSDNPVDFEAALEGIDTMETSEMNQQLAEEPSYEKIKLALF
ncbi:uncharacterized protein LOC110700859 [Chenopodium quinoa]|uniref:uncharacterized protein LOC110700859 n=1 Tax=Chenopodium quinoa TaxID=63459 RepID=UPI000B798443|nr:uncharacterized protein LOC110700859 [Chenopodium quinoa]